jgi:hypothetical protein
LLDLEKSTLSDCTHCVVAVSLVSGAALTDLGYSTERYNESPGVYDENNGVVALYNTEQNTILHIN